MFVDKFFRTWEGPFSFTREAVRLNAPDKPGVYELLYLKEIVYIGLSIDSIRSRLTKHVTGHGNWAAARRADAAGYDFVYYLCDADTSRQIESHVISNDKPPFNVKPEYKHFIENITVH
jgi:excinuclease UvrABC nuclease subunit